MVYGIVSRSGVFISCKSFKKSTSSQPLIVADKPVKAKNLKEIYQKHSVWNEKNKQILRKKGRDNVKRMKNQERRWLEKNWTEIVLEASYFSSTSLRQISLGVFCLIRYIFSSSRYYYLLYWWVINTWICELCCSSHSPVTL